MLKSAGTYVLLCCLTLSPHPGAGQGFTGDVNDLTDPNHGKTLFNSNSNQNNGRVVIRNSSGFTATDDADTSTSQSTFVPSTAKLELNINPGGTGSLVLKRDSASAADFLTIEGKDGAPFNFATGSISYDTRKNAFIFMQGLQPVSPVVAQLAEVVTYSPSFANTTSPVALGQPVVFLAKQLTKGTVLRCYANGRYSMPQSETIEWSIRKNSADGTKVAGNVGPFSPDITSAVSNGFWCVNIEFTVRGDPGIATPVQGGGYVAMQKSNGDTRTSGVDFANSSVDFSTGFSLRLCARFRGAAGDSITMTNCRWEIITAETTTPQ